MLSRGDLRSFIFNLARSPKVTPVVGVETRPGCDGSLPSVRVCLMAPKIARSEVPREARPPAQPLPFVLDEEFRHHGLPPAEVASIEVSCGVTLVPGVARQRSPTTTRSSSLRPEVITRKSPINWPNCT